MGDPVAKRTLHELVAAAATRAPDAVAITTGTQSVTYRDLMCRAEHLAGRLVQAGAGPGVYVGVIADRRIQTVVSFLGVLLSGAAYVPIGAELPAERRQFIAEQAAIRLWTGAADAAQLTGAAAFVPADDEVHGEPAPTLPRCTARDAAYVIFTSGSTSTPKGVVVEHGAVVASTLARYRLYPTDSMAYLVCATPTVDAYVAGLYFTLSSGGRVVLPSDEEVLDAQLLGELVARERVTHLDALPSQYAAVLAYHAEDLEPLRCVILGGDVLPYALAREHRNTLPQAVLFNEYGPTETTVWCTSHRCGPADRGPGVPIGRPAPGMRVTVRGADLHEAPPGTPGEIFVAGPWLARGYLGQPALTAQCFGPDPDHPGERMYRTGDLGQLDENGELEFLGRIDSVVKVRGYRVGLTEIEAKLLEHPDVTHAAVVAENGAAGPRLVAIVVPAATGTAGAGDLARFLRTRLPAYMIPTKWRRAEALPHLANGKVDRPYLVASGSTLGTALPP